jgi:hypothetical protein
MRMEFRFVGSCVGIAMLGSAMAAAALAGEIQQRKENQQQRIAQGVHSGQLTAGETANLDRKEAGLNREERDMRQDNGGRLTAGQRQKINRQQNRLSRNIYRDKHNGKTRR